MNWFLLLTSVLGVTPFYFQDGEFRSFRWRAIFLRTVPMLVLVIFTVIKVGRNTQNSNKIAKSRSVVTSFLDTIEIVVWSVAILAYVGSQVVTRTFHRKVLNRLVLFDDAALLPWFLRHFRTLGILVIFYFVPCGLTISVFVLPLLVVPYYLIVSIWYFMFVVYETAFVELLAAHLKTVNEKLEAFLSFSPQLQSIKYEDLREILIQHGYLAKIQRSSSRIFGFNKLIRFMTLLLLATVSIYLPIWFIVDIKMDKDSVIYFVLIIYWLFSHVFTLFDIHVNNKATLEVGRFFFIFIDRLFIDLYDLSDSYDLLIIYNLCNVNYLFGSYDLMILQAQRSLQPLFSTTSTIFLTATISSTIFNLCDLNYVFESYDFINLQPLKSLFSSIYLTSTIS